MTPAKLWELQKQKRTWLYIAEGPIAQLSSLVYGANRDPGDPNSGRPAGPIYTRDDFRLFRRPDQRQTLAAKDVDYNLNGAECNQSEWGAYVTARTSREI